MLHGEIAVPRANEGKFSIFFWYWLPWYAYLATIFFLSSLERPDQTFGIEIKDYYAHPAEYLFLPILTFRAFQKSNFSFLKDRFFIRGILFCLLYAATDEIHQLFIPNRTCDIKDWICDAIGITLGVVTYRFWIKRHVDLQT